MMEITDKVIVLAVKKALAQNIRYVLSVYNDQKETYDISFHPEPYCAGVYVIQNYGADGIKFINNGKSKIWKLLYDNSKPDGIGMTRISCNITVQ